MLNYYYLTTSSISKAACGGISLHFSLLSLPKNSKHSEEIKILTAKNLKGDLNPSLFFLLIHNNNSLV